MNITEVASKLARNPLGVIVFFLVLIYGIAALVLGLSSLTPEERTPLIWFIVLFPVLMLGSFLWLVIKHTEKLYAPSDYKDERHFVRLLDRKLEPQIRGLAGKVYAQLEEAQSKISALESEKAAQAKEAYADLSKNYKLLMQAVNDGYIPSFSTVVKSAAASEVLDEATASAAATVSAASSPVTMSELQQLLESYQEAGRVEPILVPEDYMKSIRNQP